MVPVEGCDPIVGAALWVMQDCRRRTLRELESVRDEWLDAVPPMGHNTLGTILYHMAAAEVGWLYDDLLKKPFPPDLKALFPTDDRDEQGMLARLKGSPLSAYLDRLAIAREHFISEYKAMSVEDFRRLREITYWTGETHWLTAEFILYHLVNHDAEHRGEITMIREHFRELSETK